MNPIIQSKIAELAEICNKRRVRRLALFGSGTNDHFEPTSSDLDLLVEFKPMLPTQHADNYFSLMEDLQKLFGVQVDLVEPGPIRNPYFRQAIEQTQLVIYEAA